jgi:predicted ATPase
VDTFSYGAAWVRADFHLHTKADKEFEYLGDENYYNSAYISALKDAGIGVGVITNHNKFDYEEFKALRSTAGRQGIFLMPGIELSVNDGANGIHMQVVFSDKWIEKGQDYITPFLATMFQGKPALQYQNENGRSDKNILQVIDELQKNGRDYFLVFAHVEDPKGLWEEMGGGKLSDWATERYAEVRRHTLGFQKVRTRDSREKVKAWLGNWYPAEVEGSDPKKIEEIGKGEKCFLKLGALTFEAVKFALISKEDRFRLDIAPKTDHSYINQACFEGGALNGLAIRFSPELNTFIGIRGSGKSSVLEALRYTLGIDLEDSAIDKDYKQKLVKWALGSGGKVVIDATDCYGQRYQIQRILDESINVFFEGKVQPGISVCETVLRKPLFFGQKELAATGKNSNKDLIEKLIGTKCEAIRREIANQKVKVTEAVERLSRVYDVDERIKEQAAIKDDTEFRLKLYKDHGVEAKLQKRLNFDADIRQAKKGITLIEKLIADVRDLLAKHEDELRNYPGYVSTENPDVFNAIDAQFGGAIRNVDLLRDVMIKFEATLEFLKNEKEKVVAKKDALSGEFAAIKRDLTESLKATDSINLDPDEFLSLNSKLSNAGIELTELSKIQSQRTSLQDILHHELAKLRDLWHQEFKIISGELDAVSNKNTALSFSVDFKGDKEAFLEYIKRIFAGSGIRGTAYQAVIDNYPDFIEVYKDFENAKKLFGSSFDTFTAAFMKNLKELLTFQPPNKFTIMYHDKELAHHSLGQRASALILFVLGQRENDIVIIDQPEDDLDNQTIYEDVIKLIIKLKPNVQFIFATHNPNIPVLGDAEQIHACSPLDEKIEIKSGALDEPSQQGRIVKIMEGGETAFERRKEIYQIWKS